MNGEVSIDLNRLGKILSAPINWYKKQGYRVALSKSSGWVEFAKGVFQAFPYHWIINPSDDEIMDLFKTNRMIALRYSTSFTSPIGQVSYHVIYDKPSYSLISLPKKARHDVTHGLEHAKYEPITMGKLAYDGWELRHETLMRQRREHAETREFWEKMCLCAEDLPGFEPWGAFHNGELVAALLSYILDDTVGILYQQSKTEHLKFCVNNALTFVFTQAVLQRPEVRCIFYGLHSLDAPPGVDQFKLRMGYSAKPVRQRVVFNPLFQPLVNNLSLGFLQKLQRFWHGNSFLNKAEGMFRFYLSGKRILSEQQWPEILDEQKAAFLAQR